MKAFIIAIALFGSLLAPTAGAGPLIVRNGGGQSEFYILLAKRTLNKLLEICLAQTSCHQDSKSELQTLRSADFSNRLDLSFSDSRSMGNFLIQNSGQQILINKDLLVTEKEGEIQAWKYNQAVAFIVEVAGSLAGIDPQTKRSLTARLIELSQAQFIPMPLADKQLQHFSLVQFYAPFSSLVIEDNSGGEKAEAFEIPLEKTLNCEASTELATPFLDFEIATSRWLFVNRHIGTRPQLMIIGSIRYRCPDASGTKHLFVSNYRLSVVTSDPDQKSHRGLDISTLQIEQESIRERSDVQP